jgi:hypothetical protein
MKECPYCGANSAWDNDCSVCGRRFPLDTGHHDRRLKRLKRNPVFFFYYAVTRVKIALSSPPFRQRRLVIQSCVKKDCPRYFSGGVGLHYCAYEHPEWIKSVIFVQKRFRSIRDIEEDDDDDVS